jgi:hypothetical protein
VLRDPGRGGGVRPAADEREQPQRTGTCDEQRHRDTRPRMRRRKDRDRRPHRRAERSRTGDRPRSAFCVRRSRRLRRRQGLGGRHRLDGGQCRGCGFRGFPAYRRRRGNIGGHWVRLVDHREPPDRWRGRAHYELSRLCRPGRNTRARGCGNRERGRAGGRRRIGQLARRGRRRQRIGGRLRSRRRFCGRRARHGRGRRRRVRYRSGHGRRAGRRRGYLPLRIRRDRCRRDRDRSSGDRTGRKKAQGIDVPVRIARQPDAEVQVRLSPLRVA